MKVLKLIAVLLAVLLSIEIVLRLFGIRPYPQYEDEQVDPFKGFMCYDDSIGFLPCESEKRVMYQAGQIRFKITHLKDGSRFCRYQNVSRVQDMILLTGDSNIHGDGVDDSNHVGFRLQRALPSFHIINRAIPGSGTIS